MAVVVVVVDNHPAAATHGAEYLLGEVYLFICIVVYAVVVRPSTPHPYNVGT